MSGVWVNFRPKPSHPKHANHTTTTRSGGTVGRYLKTDPNPWAIKIQPQLAHHSFLKKKASVTGLNDGYPEIMGCVEMIAVTPAATGFSTWWVNGKMGRMQDAFSFQRKHIRYANWDYRTPGYYFITICTAQRRHLFSDPKFVQCAATVWNAIPTQPHAAHISLDSSVIMPDHMHGIMKIRHFADPNQHEPQPSAEFKNAAAGSIGSIVGIYKSLVARQINALRGTPSEVVWHRGYWDRIVRNEKELNRIRRYIDENPRRWNENCDNLDEIQNRMIYHP